MRIPGGRFLLLLAAGFAGAGAEPPCLTATAACRERLTLGRRARYIQFFRNYPLAVRNEAVRSAAILIHGARRNGDDYFRTLLASAAVAGRLSDALLISPVFKGREGTGCKDAAEAGELTWPCDGWKGGEAATNGDPAEVLYSFDAVDRLIALLNDKARFPNLAHITVAGHSAGGQFLHRYAAANRAEAASAVPVSYVVANPSSYLYVDDRRLPRLSACQANGTCSAPFRPYWDRENCTTFNTWKYGLEKRAGYAAAIPDATLRAQLAARRVTYLLGDLDRVETSDLDMTCPAMAQGPNRRERGLNYWNYIRSLHNARHGLEVVSGCGHSATCVYASPQGAALLFPPGR